MMEATRHVAPERSLPSTAPVVVSGRADRRVDGQHEFEEIAKRSSESGVGKLVANTAPFGFRYDEATSP